MYQRNDLLMGQIALQWGYVNAEQLQQCLTLQAGQHRRRPIGAILLDSGFITEERLARLVEEQRRRMKEYAAYAQARKEELLFGKLLVKGGQTTQERVNEALGAQQDLSERGMKKRLGELLVDAGHIDTETVVRTLRAQGKKLMSCRLCRSQYNVLITVAEGMTCRRCGRPLEESAESVKADETSFLLPVVPPLPPRPPTVRAAVPPPPPPEAPRAPLPPPVTARTAAVRRKRRALRILILVLGILALILLLLTQTAG